MRESSENIQRTIELSRQLLYTADLGDLDREDDSCGVFYGIVRDSAYTIIDVAERERQRHLDRKPASTKQPPEAVRPQAGEVPEKTGELK